MNKTGTLRSGADIVEDRASELMRRLRGAASPRSDEPTAVSSTIFPISNRYQRCLVGMNPRGGVGAGLLLRD